MRHKKAGRQLNRNASHRTAMYRNMCVSIIMSERIETTVPKAKEVRRFLEPLITKAATNDLATRRYLFAKLRSVEAVNKLLDVLGPRFAARPGGYLRVLKSRLRSGDHAPMAYVLLVKEKAPEAVEESSSDEKTS